MKLSKRRTQTVSLICIKKSETLLSATVTWYHSNCWLMFWMSTCIMVSVWHIIEYLREIRGMPHHHLSFKQWYEVTKEDFIISYRMSGNPIFLKHKKTWKHSFHTSFNNKSQIFLYAKYEFLEVKKNKTPILRFYFHFC